MILDERQRTIVQDNINLVYSSIHKYFPHLAYDEDVQQSGFIGLCKAAFNFDVTRGFKFSTYAVPLIVGEVKRYLRDFNKLIQVSRSVKDLAYKALRMRDKLESETMSEVTDKDIAAALKVPVKRVTEALIAISEPMPLDTPIYHGDYDDLTLEDTLPNKHNTDMDETVIIKDAIHKLPTREQVILHYYYDRGLSQMEIASEIGISQAQISRLLKRGKKQLKSTLLLAKCATFC